MSGETAGRSASGRRGDRPRARCADRAAIVAALGDKATAVTLLRQANAEGQWMNTWHYTPALDSLRGYAPFDALITPQR